jgi:hypothetical protein
MPRVSVDDILAAATALPIELPPLDKIRTIRKKRSAVAKAAIPPAPVNEETKTPAVASSADTIIEDVTKSRESHGPIGPEASTEYHPLRTLF